MPVPLHYFSLKWCSEHEIIDPLGVPTAPLQAESEQVLTQGIWAPKGKENIGSRSGDRRGARKALWPPALVRNMVFLLFYCEKHMAMAFQDGPYKAVVLKIQCA